MVQLKRGSVSNHVWDSPGYHRYRGGVLWGPQLCFMLTSGCPAYFFEEPTELKPHHPLMVRSHAPFEPFFLFSLWKLLFGSQLGSCCLGMALGWLPAPLGSSLGCDNPLLSCGQHQRARLSVQSFYHLGVAGNIAHAPSLSSESSVATTLLGMHFSHLFHGSLSDFPHTPNVT